MHEVNCNCGECIWPRIVQFAGEDFFTKRQIPVSYYIQNETVVWQPNENGNQKNLYPQSMHKMLACIEARQQDLPPGQYPGSAQSYKWALFNDPRIWKIL